MKKTLLLPICFCVFACSMAYAAEISDRDWATALPPTEKYPFVTHKSFYYSPPYMGLAGSNIALWQSHGLYYQGHDEWGWQRPRLWQTCEDLFTQSYVMPFLMPMLENAGAYVLSPRERDISRYEYIVDNDDKKALYRESKGKKKWEKSKAPGFAYDYTPLHDRENPFKGGTAREAQVVDKAKNISTVSWNVDIEQDGDYAIYVSYQSHPNSAPDAVYTINAANGQHEVTVNQQMGGGTWIYLGHYPLKAGVSDMPIVSLSNLSAHKNAVVSADAVKIGGGMGNVARRPSEPDADGVEYDYIVSGMPRFLEGARYWLQWAGAPDSVYSATGYTNEYNDDYRSRGLWVNWLTGGSSMLPKEKGLNIPIDLSLGFHSDAGITDDDAIVGTLGIYCTDNAKFYPNGTMRTAARDLTDLILTNITRDVRASFEPKWTRRDMWNKSYAEARVPQVPAVLLELLSHQNFADMRYGLDPTFRFAVSRAIYKAMLQFIAHRDGRPYVVQPLPVRAFAISDVGDDNFRLTWTPRVDPQEATAAPTYYVVEQRVEGSRGFTPIAVVRAPENSWVINVADSKIHSYRIVACNGGGASFPSEVLALCNKPHASQVLVVNGFTRVSAPDWIDTEEFDGFLNVGVPYIQDISYVGEQTEFRRNIPWMSNEVAGLGASRGDYEDKVIAGNTFDFVALHGESIVEAGYGFVSSSVEAFVASDLEDAPRILDLIMGNQREYQVGSGKYGTRFKTFDAPLQSRLTQYANGGGNIFVSGSYIGTDLWNNPHSSATVKDTDTKFAKDVLGYVWRAADASGSGEITAVKSRFKVFDNIGTFTFATSLNDSIYSVFTPGAIGPASNAGAIVMRYSDGRLPAATAYEAPTHRAVALGVPFETIEPKAQHRIMKAALDFLSDK